MRVTRMLVAIVLVMLAACAHKTVEPIASSKASGSATPQPTPCVLSGATTDPSHGGGMQSTSAVIDVRHQSQGCPRIVFEFANGVPGYKIDYEQPPFADCGSGEPVATTAWGASAYLSVRLEPSGSVDLSKSANPTYTGPRDIAVDGPVLKHLKVTCDFEAVFRWIVALDARHPFKVSALEAPARLVIDVSEG